MSDWKIISRQKETAEALLNPLVGGAVPYIYKVKHLETGETRKVIAYMSVLSVIDGGLFCIIDGFVFGRPGLGEVDFSLFSCSSRGDGAGTAFVAKTAPALLLFAGSSRRSGCVPAEPYPPLKQSAWWFTAAAGISRFRFL